MGREVGPRVRPERWPRLRLTAHNSIEQAPEWQPSTGSGERDREVAKRPRGNADAEFSAQRRQLEHIVFELGEKTNGGAGSQQPAQPVRVGGGEARKLRNGAGAVFELVRET